MTDQSFLTRRTNGDTSVRADKVDIGEWDGAHSDLIVSSGKEGSETAAEGDSSATSGSTNSHAHHILFSDKSLYELLRVQILKQKEWEKYIVSLQQCKQ